MAACLVVGAGDGVGGAIARAFAAEGLEVCVTRRARNLEQLEELTASIRAGGGKARAGGEPPERVAVEPGERARWLEEAYKAADLPGKPRNVLWFAKGSVPPEQMEALLRDSAPADEAALKALANARGDRVKAYLVNKLAPQVPVFYISTPYLLMGGLLLVYFTIAAMVMQFAQYFPMIFNF